MPVNHSGLSVKPNFFVTLSKEITTTKVIFSSWVEFDLHFRECLSRWNESERAESSNNAMLKEQQHAYRQ